MGTWEVDTTAVKELFEYHLPLREGDPRKELAAGS